MGFYWDGMVEIQEDEMRCRKCQWVWRPHVREPVACPKCKRYGPEIPSRPVGRPGKAEVAESELTPEAARRLLEERGYFGPHGKSPGTA
jgi:hypothetical protein